ncbi:anillin isoform X2 [Dunckerocampus dactyliophorus]|uniref:anillin isoform X2 n=1 Tax=Dunckerocampus dactyliophorus TaxID=161453 RepID=UPI002406F128|nr:anillin isoform X2 [Dunckerocampus dactyliophorus]
MDPFTEKLLERTRARRENLQKKIAERPNAANRQMVKRAREPLADTNSVIGEPATAPQMSTKPSPSKRRCSSENVQPVEGDKIQPVAPVLQDPPSDKKPPVCPTSVRPASSTGRSDGRPVAQLEETKTVESERMAVTAPPKMQASRIVATVPETPKNKEDAAEDSALPATGMKSRLRKLAEQRKFWDGDHGCLTDTSDADSTPLSLLRQKDDVPTSFSCPTASSETPVGRRGRLANLAATIGSWEDDVSHAIIPKEEAPVKLAPAKLAPASAPQISSKDASTAAGAQQKAADHAASTSPASKSSLVSNQLSRSLAKPGAKVPPSPQKADTPAATSTLQPVTSPQKTTPVPPGSSSSTSVSWKNKDLSTAPSSSCTPQKVQLCAKASTPSATVPQGKSSAPGVKSFLERFEERCQERTKQCSPAGGGSQTTTPSTRLALRTAQTPKTTTADLIQKQKLERESELAQIQSRFRGNNMWKNREAGAETKKTIDSKGHVGKPVDSDDHPESHFIETPATPAKSISTGCGLLDPPPSSTSSPLRDVARADKETTDESTKEEEVDEGKEIEMNVDQSINSAVINDLFEGVLEQSDDQDREEDEEEDALNISSMSLLTPLAETVAAVVKSPERRIMTSTPANSFMVKNDTPDKVHKPGQFQRANIRKSGSSDSIVASEDDHKLPYSIDAYRSIRVKETGRANMKDVMVRKEDVSGRAEEARGSSLFSIKQKMKALTNEMNLQQTIIHQASQALNCCTDEEHGKGSQVEAEAERLLLVATEKREVLKTELQRLKGEGPAGQKKNPALLQPTGISASKGSISLREFRLPLKADFVCSTANKPESVKYSFFIMIRSGAENMVATPLASTHRGLSGDTLTFPTTFSISDVSSDFCIDIDVYYLVQKRELSGDKKKKAGKSKAITPKRFLAITKGSQTPVLASPGGPNAVRTSNFVLVGSYKLTLSSVGKNKFALEKVPFLCPLEGHVHLKMQCEVGCRVEEKGFLTMFEDVSGFGAWHRRWCVLSGYCISYWTYPDDEKRKNPIGRINLANCTSIAVEPANREFCARPNTFELITARPQREDDKETLVSQCKNTMCVTTNWLSADTKDERNLWMKKLNQILTDVRMWQPDACHASKTPNSFC